MMEQKKEIYECLDLTVTEFDAEDVISTSEVYFGLEEYEKMLQNPMSLPLKHY